MPKANATIVRIYAKECLGYIGGYIRAYICGRRLGVYTRYYVPEECYCDNRDIRKMLGAYWRHYARKKAIAIIAPLYGRRLLGHIQATMSAKMI
jgi:hypothetical protein